MTMDYPQLLSMLALIVSIGACDSGNKPAEEEPPPPTPETVSSCERLNAFSLDDGSGLLSVQLPVELEVAESVQLVDTQGLQVLSFDAASATVSLAAPAARHPIQIRFDVIDDADQVLAEHTHTVVVDPVRVMPYGDSITSGIEFFDGVSDLPELPVRVGYRKALYDRLLSNGYIIDYLGQSGQRAGADAGLADPDNNGYPGVDIGFLRDKLNAVLAENATDVFLIHIGTNNTPDNALELMALLDDIDVWEAQNHPVTVMLATIVPARNQADNALIELYNTDMRARVQARTDDRLVLVEQNLALTVDDISLEDLGKHPNAAGYQKMADAWYASLTGSSVLQNCNP